MVEEPRCSCRLVGRLGYCTVFSYPFTSPLDFNSMSLKPLYLSLALLSVFSALSGCAVISVASTAVSVAGTAVNVGVTAGSVAVSAATTVTKGVVSVGSAAVEAVVE